jgi:hypothetical protein
MAIICSLWDVLNMHSVLNLLLSIKLDYLPIRTKSNEPFWEVGMKWGHFSLFSWVYLMYF